MKLSGCLDSLFVREVPIVEDRIRACADAGLDAVEFWLWRDKDLDRLERRLDETGLGLTLFSSEPRTPLVDPALHGAFVTGLRESVAAAARLGSRALCVLVDDNGMGGSSDPRTSMRHGAQHDAIVTALKLAAPIAADAGVLLLIEPLNSRLDHVGYFLDRTPEGLDLIEEVGEPSIRLLYDLYHSTMMEERPEDVLDSRGHLVGHVHVADVPGRHEPGTGTIDWASSISTLRRLGYAGPIGLEYWPTGPTTASIAETRRLLCDDRIGASEGPRRVP